MSVYNNVALYSVNFQCTCTCTCTCCTIINIISTCSMNYLNRIQVDDNVEKVYSSKCTLYMYNVLVSTVYMYVCCMELTLNRISWKQASQLVRVGMVCSFDDLTSTKEKCARALAMIEGVDDLLLIVRGAVLDSSVFAILEGFLNALSPQQRSHLVLGVGIKVHVNVQALNMLSCT